MRARDGQKIITEGKADVGFGTLAAGKKSSGKITAIFRGMKDGYDTQYYFSVRTPGIGPESHKNKGFRNRSLSG